MRRLARMRELEVWIAWVRLGGVLFAFLEVGIFAPGYPGNYEAYAWATTGVFAVGAMALWQLTRRAYRPVVGLVALVFDLCVIAAYSTVYPYEYGAPTRWALILVVIEGALRYGLRGGVSLSVVLLPFLVFLEWWRAHEFGGPHFITDRVTFPFGIFVLSGIIVGWLVRRPGGQAELAGARAYEAESCATSSAGGSMSSRPPIDVPARSGRRLRSTEPSARSFVSSAASSRSIA